MHDVISGLTEMTDKIRRVSGHSVRILCSLKLNISVICDTCHE
jgi:hypothetical protein